MPIRSPIAWSWCDGTSESTCVPDASESVYRKSAPRNAFSAKRYRALNFVVDLPVRVDDLLSPLDPMADELGRVVFSLVEFQVVDRDTAARNEEGDSSHERYKRRQLKEVLRRLSRGLVVPKRSAARRRASRPEQK